MKTVGIISDTHGLLRPEAVKALEGVDLIIHAGDIGMPSIISHLERIAPVHAVRGNIDRAPWTADYSETQIVEVGDLLIYVLHDLGQIDLDPAAAGFHVVVYGHSHEPEVRQSRGVIYLNPGSAGPRRFRLPVAVARLVIGSNGETHNGPPRAWPTMSHAFDAAGTAVEAQMITLEA